jgi:hypothetical protein
VPNVTTPDAVLAHRPGPDPKIEMSDPVVVVNLSRALRAPASPRHRAGSRPNAGPGYGKRSVPDQRPPHAGDFALLPERERHIAGYVDALPEGGAMDIKSLAKALPLYGQMAVSSALRALGAAGHLRRVRGLSGEGGQVRRVTRTFWSRVAHDNEWWDAFLAVEEHHPAPGTAAAPETPVLVPVPAVREQPTAPSVPPQRTAEPQSQSQPQPQSQPQSQPQPHSEPTMDQQPSPAFPALARLGRTDARPALSSADCTALEQLAADWFARGVDADYSTQALTAGLPESVGSPFGLVRRRLHDKLPPHVPAPVTPVRRLLVECIDCGAAGPSEAFHDGLCGPCRESGPDTVPMA